MKLIYAILWILALGFFQALAQTPLTSLAAVKALPLEECRRKLPVQIEATVTYPDPEGGGWFIHDGKTGIFLHSGETHDATNAIHFGDRLLVNGWTGLGGYQPDLYLNSLKRLSPGGFPEPVGVTEQNLFTPDLDCQWVLLTNARIIKFETREKKRIDLTFELAGWTLPAFMPWSDTAAAEVPKLLYRHVTIMAVGAETFNRQRQFTGRLFFVPGIDCIHPQTETEGATPPQLLKAHHLLRRETSTETPVRVRGVVTHATKTELFLRDSDGSIRVLDQGDQRFQPGDEVEVEGLAAIAPYRPSLCARQIRLLGKKPPPQPVFWRKEITDLSFLHAELVQVQAKYLFCDEQRAGRVLHCRSEKYFFDAFLPETDALPIDLAPGSGVELTGIFQVTASHSRPSLEEPDGFNLTLRSPADLVIVSSPSWWTARRLLLGLVGALLLVLLAGLWIRLLRRQVQAQTRQLTDQVEREATLNERQRIARDLHDTVQQQMTGLAIQLDNVVDRLDRKPELVRSTLNLARSMARHCREETGNAIRNLRCVTLETKGLEAALREKLPALTAEGSAQLQFALAEKPVRFEAVAETYFLRIAQEAVANAVRHAQAKTIIVATQYAAATVALSIQDDGCGFDPQANPAPGHFGLSGLHERADKINAALTVDSAPDKGTTVRVVLELGRAAKSAL